MSAIDSAYSVSEALAAVKDHLKTARHQVMRGEVVHLREANKGTWAHLAGPDATAKIFAPTEYLPPAGLQHGQHLEARMRLVQEKDESSYYFTAVEAVRVLEDPGPVEQELLLAMENLEHDALIDQDAWQRFTSGTFEFDQPESVELPEASRVIVLSSERIDGWGDFKKSLGGRYYDPAVVSLRQVRMSGRGLVEDLPAALNEIGAADADLVFIVRGGGSWASLRDFDDVRVARAIAQAKVPVATAVGHYSDIRLSDLVADWAFATPTVAAYALKERLRSQRGTAAKGRGKSWEKRPAQTAAGSAEQTSLQEQLRVAENELLDARRTNRASRELIDRLDQARVLAEKAAGQALLELARERVRFRARWHAVAWIVVGCLLFGLAFFGGPWVGIGAAGAVASWACAAYAWSGPRRAERPIYKRGAHRLPGSRQEWEKRIAQARTPRALRPLMKPPPPHATTLPPALAPRPVRSSILGQW